MKRLLVAGLLGVIVFALAPPASAHAELVSIQAGHAKNTVILLFSENVDVAHSSLTVAGAPQVLSPVGHRGLAVALPTRGAALAWHVASADDGHTENGRRFVDPRAFTAPAAGAAAPAAAVTAVETAATSRQLLLAARIVQYAALTVLVGGLFFLSFVWPAGGAVVRSRQLLYGAWGLGIASAAAGLGLQQTELLEQGPGRLTDLQTWRDALDSHVGEVWGARVLMWLLALVLLRAVTVQGAVACRSRAWKVAAIVVSLGLIRAVGLISHGVASAHPMVGAIADFTHIAAASLWLGGLAFLAIVVLPRRDAGELASVLPRYSWLALGSVTGVVLAGTALSWDLLGSWHALLSTGYGHQLLVKLALVASLLVAAQQSKGFVQRRLDVAVVLDGDRATLRPLLLSITTEALLAAAVLSAAAVLATGSPGR